MSGPFDLSGRVIAITGGNGQIGRSLVAAMVAAGARVAVLDRTLDQTAANDAVVGVETDVTDAKSLRRALSAIVERWETPAGLVNAAAIDAPPDASPEDNGPFETFSEVSFDKVMGVNVKGVMLCCQVFGGAMAQAGRGSIVNVSSIYGMVSPDQSLYSYRRELGEDFYKPVAYSVSKSALFNLTRYLATYWGAKGVRVNTVSFAGIAAKQHPAFLEKYHAKVPLGRMADVKECCGPVQFLLADASSYVTGSNLVVDGGFTAW